MQILVYFCVNLTDPQLSTKQKQKWFESLEKPNFHACCAMPLGVDALRPFVTSKKFHEMDIK